MGVLLEWGIKLGEKELQMGVKGVKVDISHACLRDSTERERDSYNWLDLFFLLIFLYLIINKPTTPLKW